MSDKKIKRDDLGNRMKTFYEQIPKQKSGYSNKKK